MLTIVPTTFISGNFYNDIMLTIQSKFFNAIPTSPHSAKKKYYIYQES